MKRYTLFVLIVMGSTATAIAAIAPEHRTAFNPRAANITVIEKNQAWPLVGPLTVEDCLTEDCSDTQV